MNAGGFKKWSTYFTMGCFFLAGGVEYSVIFPTMLDYVRSKHGKEWLYGLCLAAFSISNLITAPLYGLLFDKTHKTKYIVLFANLFEIGGNFMYYTSSSKDMILGSRFVVGMGAGAGATIIGELSRTTAVRVRTAVLSVFIGVRQIGLVIGPAFNLFLAKCNFNVGPFVTNSLTSPGAFMVIVWLFVQVLFACLFFSLPALVECPTEPGETTPLVAEKLSAKQHSVNITTVPQNYTPWAMRVRCLVKEETVVVLAVLFVVMFQQTALETMCVPMAKDLLHWKEEQLSGFYSVAGVVVIMGFVLVTVLSRTIEDRWLIVGGLTLELIGYVWMIALVGQATDETPWVFWRFAVGSFFSVFGLPFVLVPGTSLFSKLLPAAIQGFGHGFRRSTFSLAAILGPLWAGGSGVKGAIFSNYYGLLAIPCGLLLFVLVLMVLSFSRLKIKSR